MSAMTTDYDQPLVELTIKLPVELSDKLQDIASVEGTDLQLLIKRYLEEGILQSMPEVKRKSFFGHIKEIMRKHNVPPEVIDEIEDKFTY
jgi:predicted transcriptional regulator